MSKQKDNKKKTFITGANILNQKNRALSAIKKEPIYNGGDNEEHGFVKHNRLYEKILFNTRGEDYYNDVYTLYKIKPGITFIKRLFNHEKSEIAVPYLKLNIPETYWNDTEMFYVYNDWNNYGALTVIRNKKDFNLFNAFDRVEREQYMRQVKDIEPFIIIRGETMSTVDRYEKCKENLGKDIGDGIVQRYIRCKGRNRQLDKKNMTSYSSYCGMLDDRFTILGEIGDGGYAKVYKVQDPKTNKEYAAKVVQRFCQNEFKVNSKLSNLKNPYIIKYISFSQGSIKLDNYVDDCKPYFLFELATKGDLSKYINCGRGGFKESHCKLIFQDILNGIQVIHKTNICHRDIKTQNILLDSDNFNIKICDFGFSSDSTELLTGCFGTKEFMAPEIIIGNDYDGIKADIFSLGVLLLNLRTSKFLFEKAKGLPYDYIKKNDKLIWTLGEVNGISGLSKEFKELYLKMVAFNPKERPNIEDILNCEWLKEINDLSEDDRGKLRREVIKEFQLREEIILGAKDYKE